MENKPTLSPIDINAALSHLISLKGSTTYFLEDLSNRTIQVQIQSQTKDHEAGKLILKRTVIMYSCTSATPALFCQSELELGALKSSETEMLLNTSTPIGKVFKILNEDQLVKKERIEVSLNANVGVQNIMKLSDPFIYSKTYQFLVGERNVGLITEYFNHESLLRLWNH